MLPYFVWILKIYFLKMLQLIGIFVSQIRTNTEQIRQTAGILVINHYDSRYPNTFKQLSRILFDALLIRIHFIHLQPLRSRVQM